jgi:hypothetical protein
MSLIAAEAFDYSCVSTRGGPLSPMVVAHLALTPNSKG